MKYTEGTLIEIEKYNLSFLARQRSRSLLPALLNLLLVPPDVSSRECKTM